MAAFLGRLAVRGLRGMLEPRGRMPAQDGYQKPLNAARAIFIRLLIAAEKLTCNFGV